MSTAGIAMHYRSKKPVSGESAAMRERAARLAARDAAYRAALHLPAEGPLPASIGSVRHNSVGWSREVYTGGRTAMKPNPSQVFG